MSGKFENYYGYVETQADELLAEYSDELAEELQDSTVDLATFFDQGVHEWVDNDMIYNDLHECADILEQSDNVETDWGLWDGENNPSEAIKTQAFYTYRYDLMEAVKEATKNHLEYLQAETQTRVNRLQESIDELESVIDDLKMDLEDLAAEDEENDAQMNDIDNDINDNQTNLAELEEQLEEVETLLANIEETIDNI